MENVWRVEGWKPTCHYSDGSSDASIFDIQFSNLSLKAPTRDNIGERFEVISECTRDILRYPYNAMFWALRAIQLSSCGYPELGASDARRADRLFRAMLDSERAEELGCKARRDFYTTVMDSVIGWPGKILVEHIESGPPLPPHQRESLIDLHWKNYTVLVHSMNLMQEFHGAHKICEEARAYYPNEDVFPNALASSKKEMQKKTSMCASQGAAERARYGEVTYREYPFMLSKHLQRSLDLVQSIDIKLREFDAKCTLSTGTIGQPESPVYSLQKKLTWMSMSHFANPLKRPSEVLGLIANCDIKPGEIIFKDSTPIGVSCKSGSHTWRGEKLPICDHCHGLVMPTKQNKDRPKVFKPKCCDARFCSKECLESARSNYHHAVCGKDFKWLYRDSSPPTSEIASDYQNDGVMWLRILATCVQSALHPLDHPIIAALTPNYGDVARRWSVTSHLDDVHRILTTLGVDVFTDMRFDGWVLQTVWARLANNVRCAGGGEGPAARDLNPLYSFLNHVSINTSDILRACC
ncbi:hypothetical protein HYFRA_00007946 [Hymenoscyphus fraxineus]|uniref:Suppressor of anucleate metulae protein B n=1 Tax=Hymenoscyphus fraxineus TaxID=746836 RepID=A0A9N9PG34_9HELO|nr:hypothetical protein HYFRA_00007946 [Hymenoscyphus fraxineus]